MARRFANGELIALVGEADRAGHRTPVLIAQYIVATKGLDVADRKLATRLRFSVTDCRKRLNAKGA